MDLAGPKLRTGTLKPGPCVMKVSPKKDAYGNVVSPAVVWFSLTGTEPPAQVSPDGTISVQDQDFLAGLQIGDSVRLCDARGRKRRLRISKEFHVFSVSPVRGLWLNVLILLTLSRELSYTLMERKGDVWLDE